LGEGPGPGPGRPAGGPLVGPGSRRETGERPLTDGMELEGSGGFFSAAFMISSLNERLSTLEKNGKVKARERTRGD
jgi:hypothetical protein